MWLWWLVIVVLVVLVAASTIRLSPWWDKHYGSGRNKHWPTLAQQEVGDAIVLTKENITPKDIEEHGDTEDADTMRVMMLAMKTGHAALMQKQSDGWYLTVGPKVYWGKSRAACLDKAERDVE